MTVSWVWSNFTDFWWFQWNWFKIKFYLKKIYENLCCFKCFVNKLTQIQLNRGSKPKPNRCLMVWNLDWFNVFRGFVWFSESSICKNWFGPRFTTKPNQENQTNPIHVHPYTERYTYKYLIRIGIIERNPFVHVTCKSLRTFSSEDLSFLLHIIDQ